MPETRRARLRRSEWLGWALCLLMGAVMAPPAARAHDLPRSQLVLRIQNADIEATIEAPAVDFAHDLPTATLETLLTPAGAAQYQNALAAIVASRLVVTADGAPREAALERVTPLPDRRALRLQLRFPGTKRPGALQVRCRLFPYDPRHQTFLDIYENQRLKRQTILDTNHSETAYALGRRQGPGEVVREFFAEGVHHIFIGPDHILFVIGLLLLGGTLKQLLKIVSAFTIAHSVTLAAATLGWWNPSARIVEPAIALSIVFVGVHSLVAGKHDARLLFAFAFGLIHGFGFASVLRELELPRDALAWSLLSFNAGVEFGQACIVLSVAPLLALLHRRSRFLARRVVAAGSAAVIFAGAYWFVQHVWYPG